MSTLGARTAWQEQLLKHFCLLLLMQQWLEQVSSTVPALPGRLHVMLEHTSSVAARTEVRCEWPHLTKASSLASVQQIEASMSQAPYCLQLAWRSPAEGGDQQQPHRRGQLHAQGGVFQEARLAWQPQAEAGRSQGAQGGCFRHRGGCGAQCRQRTQCIGQGRGGCCSQGKHLPLEGHQKQSRQQPALHKLGCSSNTPLFSRQKVHYRSHSRAMRCKAASS